MKTIHKNLLIAASLFLLAGAGCTQPAATSLETVNSNETAVNTTPANTNEAVVTNTNVVLENTNTATSNTNESDGETTGTSDWLTYTNEEYGFSFRYPSDWEINGKGTNNIRIYIEKIDDLPTEQYEGPRSGTGPQSRSESLAEQSNLLVGEDSSYGGKLVQVYGNNFYRYIAYVEGGGIAIEHVTYLENNKVTLRFFEGDNDDFAKALEQSDRASLYKQYGSGEIENANMRSRYNTLEIIISTFAL